MIYERFTVATFFNAFVILLASRFLLDVVRLVKAQYIVGACVKYSGSPSWQPNS